MTLIILDPNLEGEAGHHLAYDLAIAREAIARGEPATIIANRRFGATTIEGVRIVPHFTETCYARRHTDEVTGRFDDYRHFNDLLQAELAALPRGEFRPADAVLVPTVTENHLAGFLGWMKGFDPLEAPLFVVHLMLPSGMVVDRGRPPAVEDPLRALFYRLADRVVQEPGPPVHLFASGGQHAAEYGALFGRAVAPHPLPIRPEPAPRAADAPLRALVFAGDARADKGIGLLPALLPRLAAAHPEWRFVAHVNADGAWGEAKAAAEALAALPAGLPNLDLARGRLSPEAYLALLRGTRLALLPYDPVAYRRKSSGVLWEAISLGTPAILPAGTWLEHEARHWGAGHVVYAAQDAGAVEAAFAEALPRIAELERLSAAASARYRAANGAGALLDQLAALWVRHKAVASLVTRPQVMPVDLARVEAGWHASESVEGRMVRWTAQEPVVAFDWPFAEPWEAEFTLQSFFGAEQLDKAEALVGEGRASIAWSRLARGARLVVRGEGPGRARPRVELRLRLPFTHRPPRESRDLGVLVAALRVGPAGTAAPAAPAALPFIRVAGEAPAGGGWPVDPGVSGEVQASPDAPCMLAFRLRAEAAEAVRALVLYVDDAALRLDVSAEAGGTWLATARVAAATLRRAGGAATWDLLREAGAPGAAPVLMEASAAPMAGTPAPEPVPGPAEAPPPPVVAEGLRIRWDLSTGFGGEEGPFPDLGVPAGVRWVTSRAARLVLEAGRAGAARLSLVHRGLLPRQRLRLRLDGGEEQVVELAGAGLKEAAETRIGLMLAAGTNELGLVFEGAVREPGSGRELVLLIERATLQAAGEG